MIVGGGRVVPGRPVHVERADRLGLLNLAAPEDRAPGVDAISDHEHRRQRQVEGIRSDDPDRDPGREEDQEEDEVAVEGFCVGVELGALLAPAFVDQRRDPDERHRDRRQQEGRADDRPDGDILGALGAADDRDDRDQRLGHRRADGGEQAAGRPSPSSSRWPAHSTALVNSRAPARITAKLTASRKYATPCLYPPRRTGTRARGRRTRRGAGSPRTSSTHPPGSRRPR